MYGVTKAVTVCTRLKKEVRIPKLYRLFTDLTGGVYVFTFKKVKKG